MSILSKDRAARARCRWAAGVAAIFVVCCSRASPPPSPPPATRPYVGRLMLDSSVAFPDGFTASLSAADRAALANQGIIIDEVRGELVFARAPLPGRWMKIGEDFYKTDADGYFSVPDVPRDVATVLMYRQILDAREEEAFALDSAGFAATRADAPVYVQSLQLASPAPMNPEPQVPSHAHGAFPPLSDGCPSRCDARKPSFVSNSAGCCQDYNGPDGDMLARLRDTNSGPCFVRAYLNFVHSTCADWSFGPLGTACSNEAAFCGVLKNQPPWCDPNLNAKPPFCYDNHRYRNCQNMNENDFSVSPTAVTVRRGGSVPIHIRNNTSANETSLRLSPDIGLLAVSTRGVPALVRLASWRVLRHYNDAARKHYEDVDLVYVAPPANTTCSSKCECKSGSTTVTITASAGKFSVPITITVDPAAAPIHEAPSPAQAAGQCPQPGPLQGRWTTCVFVEPVTGPAPGGDAATGVSHCLNERATLSVTLSQSASGAITGTYSGTYQSLSSVLHLAWPATLKGTLAGSRKNDQLELAFTGDFAAPALLQFDSSGLWWGYFTGGPDCIANQTGHDFGPQEGLMYLNSSPSGTCF